MLGIFWGLFPVFCRSTGGLERCIGFELIVWGIAPFLELAIVVTAVAIAWHDIKSGGLYFFNLYEGFTLTELMSLHLWPIDIDLSTE